MVDGAARVGVGWRRGGRRPLVAIALAGLMASIGAGVALAADHAVSISGFSYSPGTVTVAVGDTVTWTNSDAQAHTATADDNSWETGTIANNNSATVTFAAAGTFAYHCTIHPEMTGTVVVQAAAPAPTPAPGTTQPPTDTGAAGGSSGDGGPGIAFLVALGLVSLAGFVAASRRMTARG